MMEKISENKNSICEDDEKLASESTSEDKSFKKPTLLIGKRGRLPKKITQVASTSKTTDITLNDISNECKDKLEDKPQNDVENRISCKNIENKAPAQQVFENNPPLPYKEPSWSGLPESSTKPYGFEVLKNGAIIETIDLMKKTFWVFGRLANCDICMQHPTISRYHAILQYRDTPSENDPPGFYIYDLGSTHGTFLNGKNNKLKSKVYVPVRVGHILRMGCSQRSFILTGPEDDEEEESELSVTQLKQLRDQKMKEYEEKMKQAELEREEMRRKEEERGADWGLGDDADEMDDLQENPYASTTNEDLYIDDPKKALRGFFEREGLELEYDCTEQGMGQFLCKVELPLDDEMGRPIIAEALHRGKKKEAVVQCALEACKILDRFGVLRQATHESKKRKTKDWEENDYYDSDDDTFLDRTGTIEKKREKRMKSKELEKVETYESLIEKEKQLSSSITEIEKRLSAAQVEIDDSAKNNSPDEDSLDAYMKRLQENKPDRQTIAKMRLELAQLKKEHANVVRLANIAKPVDLPALVPQTTVSNPKPGTSTNKLKQIKTGFPIVGKRKVIPVKFPLKPTHDEVAQTSSGSSADCEIESDEEEEALNGCSQNGNVSNIDNNILESKQEPNVENISDNQDKSSPCDVEMSGVCEKNEQVVENTQERFELENSPVSSTRSDDLMDSDSHSEDEDREAELRRASTELLEFRPIKSFHETLTFKKFESIMRSGLPPFAGKHREKLEKILNKLKRLASNEDRMHVDWKILSAKKRKVMKLISDLRFSDYNEKLEFRVSSEFNRILSELNSMTEEQFKVIGKVKKMGHELKNISVEIDRDIQALKQGINHLEARNESTEDSSEPLPGPSSESSENKEDEKKKKKTQKRNEIRQQKAEQERQRGYEEDATRENYSMWVPPSDQSGDGRTTLNERYGY